jgi:ABC-type multidrug transport system fused ATPase/permease subunit
MKKKEDALTLSMFFRNVYQMLLMAWKAHPPLFLALATLKITQGIIPVVVAWLFKRLIDLLTVVIQNSGTTDFMRGFMPILTIYVVVTAIAQAIQAIQGYLQEEMTRQAQFYDSSSSILCRNPILP